MKNAFILITLLLFSVSSFAQLEPFNAYLGFNWNSGLRLKDEVSEAFFNELELDNSYSSYTSLNRTFSEYGVGFKTKRKNVYLDFSLLQGTDFINVNGSASKRENDTSYTIYTYADISAALVGLRSMVRLSTPAERRFVMHYSLGLEGLLAYDLDSEGSILVRPSGFFNGNNSNEVRTILDPSFTGAYGNVNIVQNVGFAFKLAKDETKFPLNKAYVESDFQLLNNFTFIDGTNSRYRTFGLILALGYQF